MENIYAIHHAIMTKQCTNRQEKIEYANLKIIMIETVNMINIIQYILF